VHMINVIRKSGINPVGCINRFHTDTDAEINREEGGRGGRRALRRVQHWLKGGEGALELADAVIDACLTKRRIQNSSTRWR